MVNQLRNAYEQADGTIIAADNPEVRKIYDTVLTAAVDEKMSTHTGQWSEDWTANFQKDGFATMACPGWMLASSRATPRVSRAGTSPTSSTAAAATGAARS